MSSALPWIIKYRPKNLSEYVDQEEAKAYLSAWIKEWLKGNIPSKRAVLLNGPPGVGKTALAEAVAGEFGLQIVEMNASDFRRKSDIERVAMIASKARSFDGKPRIILLDEVDGLSAREDLGGVEAIIDVIKATKNPIIMTCNNAYANQLRSLRYLDEVALVDMRELQQRHVLEVLKRICDSEKIFCDDKALKSIHEKNKGDLRACINDLESLGRTYGKVTPELVERLVPYRDRELDPFETLRGIFFAKYAWQAKSAAMHSQLDFDTLIQWINENIPLQLTSIENVFLAYETLSRADVYRGRIIKTGSWDFLSYANDLSTAGLSVVAKREKLKWVKYSFPSMIKLLAETKSARERLMSAASKIAAKAHVSRKTALSEFIPLIRIVYRLDKVKAAFMMKSLGIAPEEATVIVGDQEASELLSMRLSELESLLKKGEKEREGYRPAGRSRESPSKRSGQRTLF